MRYILVVLLCFSLTVFAQDEIQNQLSKNRNVLAKNLVQDLSVSKDSLVLTNDKLFSKVHFFKNDFERTFYFKPAVTKGKISLHELPIGSYTVMFYQTDKIIVFRVDRRSKFDNTIKPLPANTPPSLLAANTPNLNVDRNQRDLASTSEEPTIFDDDSKKKRYYRKKVDRLNGEQPNDRIKTKAKPKMLVMEEEGMYTYNLSNMKRDHVQTREDYRRTHLRPNGKPYD